MLPGGSYDVLCHLRKKSHIVQIRSAGGESIPGFCCCWLLPVAYSLVLLLSVHDLICGHLRDLRLKVLPLVLLLPVACCLLPVPVPYSLVPIP